MNQLDIQVAEVVMGWQPAAQEILEKFGYVLVWSERELQPGSLVTGDENGVLGSILGTQPVSVIGAASESEIREYNEFCKTCFPRPFVYKALAE